MDIKNKLSKILKKYRSEHKLSQEKMAERCDISFYPLLSGLGKREENSQAGYRC